MKLLINVTGFLDTLFNATNFALIVPLIAIVKEIWLNIRLTQALYLFGVDRYTVVKIVAMPLN